MGKNWQYLWKYVYFPNLQKHFGNQYEIEFHNPYSKTLGTINISEFWFLGGFRKVNVVYYLIFLVRPRAICSLSNIFLVLHWTIWIFTVNEVNKTINSFASVQRTFCWQKSSYQTRLCYQMGCEQFKISESFWFWGLQIRDCWFVPTFQLYLHSPTTDTFMLLSLFIM